MAINPVRLLTASNASITNGETLVNISGGVDCSRVYNGTVLMIEGYTFVEGLSGTVPNGSGISTNTLREPWPNPTVTNGTLAAFNSIEGLVGAIEKATQVVAESEAILGVGGVGLLEKTGVNSYVATPLSSQGRDLITDTTASDQRVTLGLGDAATQSVTSNNLDSTEGRITRVGDFGLGATDRILLSNIDDEGLPCGFYKFDTSTLGDKPVAVGLLQVMRSTATQPLQIAYGVGEGLSNSKVYRRFLMLNTNSFTDWEEIADSQGLIVSGTNSNGSFTRYPDGTAICRQQRNSDDTQNQLWTYPLAFISPPNVVASPLVSSLTNTSVHITSKTNTTVEFSTVRDNIRVQTANDLIAIGRWK